ncbi:MAG: PD-(D/E)XK nuclease family protein [Muribaculaceae bacterium]|nr:PD-(D/E)XK nuclease family protein [Muribaculaceae bacterium]
MTASTIYGDSCLNAIAQSYVDELNVNYVAMTRPTTELIVYSPYKAGDTFWKLLRQALEKTDTAYLDSLGMPDAAKPWIIELNSRFDGNTFTLGEPTTAKPAKKEEKDTGDGIIELTRYTTSDFIERARACTQLDITGPFDIDDPRHAGTFMHAVMSRVTTRESLELAMRRQGYRFHLDKNTYDRIYRRLRHVVEDPDASRWFDGFERVITERTVTSRGDTRRPDRLVWHRDGSVDVIDYKFVEHLPETLDGNPTHMKYVAQVEQYRKDVRGNTHADTRGYIWYITDNDSLIVQI